MWYWTSPGGKEAALTSSWGTTLAQGPDWSTGPGLVILMRTSSHLSGNFFFVGRRGWGQNRGDVEAVIECASGIWTLRTLQQRDVEGERTGIRAKWTRWLSWVDEFDSTIIEWMDRWLV